MYAAVFEYDVDPAAVTEFEAAYGPEGEWARFFARGEGYLGTDLWRAAGREPVRYLLLDRWRSAADYEAFLALHADEYRRRGRDAETLHLSETALGRYVATPRGPAAPGAPVPPG